MSNLTRTMVFTVLVPGTVTGLVPYILIARRPQIFTLPLGTAHYAGWLLLAAGVAIYLTCAWHFVFEGEGTPSPTHPTKNLVVTGLHAWSRNPFYIGVFLFLLGEAVLFQSGNQLVYAFVVILVFHFQVVMNEEPYLRLRYGDAFSAYCAKVPRWLPIGGLRRGRE
jgi:protein-S-isoprenylcysteine O-methyltransferase Ste14